MRQVWKCSCHGHCIGYSLFLSALLAFGMFFYFVDLKLEDIPFIRNRGRVISIVVKTIVFLIAWVYCLYDAYNSYGLVRQALKIICRCVVYLSFLIDMTATDITQQQNRTHNFDARVQGLNYCAA